MSKQVGFEAKDYALAVQHLFAMFGATVLVPLLTGLNLFA
jgi:xanthine/uracil permease